jgi:hypothetical protein
VIPLALVAVRLPTADDLARNFVSTVGQTEIFIANHERPFIARVYRPRPEDISENPVAHGRVDLWLDRERWESP